MWKWHQTKKMLYFGTRIALKTKNTKYCMMKSFTRLLAILLVMTATQVSAQENYIVTRIKGKVVNYKTGTSLQAGDILQPEDKVTFDTFDSYVISINQNMGRYMIKLHEPPAPESLQLTAVVKDIAIPTKRRSLMAERYKPEQSEVNDLREYFGEERFSVIGDDVEIPIDPASVKIDDNHFLVFYYRVNNNPVSKKIGYDQNTVKIEKDKLLSTSAGVISTDEIPAVSVYLYEPSTRTSDKITSFDLVFVNPDELTKEFQTILPILRKQNMDNNAIKKYLIEYFYDFYGATDSRSIKNFVDKLVDVSK